MITKGALKIYVPAKYLLTRIQRIQNRASTTKAEGGNKAAKLSKVKFQMLADFEISHVSGRAGRFPLWL